MGGDFNVVRRSGEKIGAAYNQAAMTDFSNFIEEAGLMDLPLSGGRFTWSSNRVDPTFCRLDRFLVSPSFMLTFQNLIQSILPRSLSNHHAISLAADITNWGPRPFKFFNHWTEVTGFNELVHSTWESSISTGSNSHMFWVKLKKMKVAIKEWCKQTDAGDPFKISHLEEEIDRIEKMKQANQLDNFPKEELVKKKDIVMVFI